MGLFVMMNPNTPYLKKRSLFTFAPNLKKSKREASQSMLTLFTKSPDYPDGSNAYLRDTYGMIDEATGLIKLHTTISGKEYNKFGRSIGFKLVVDDREQKIYIHVKNLHTNEILEKTVYYTFETLKRLFRRNVQISPFLMQTLYSEMEMSILSTLMFNYLPALPLKKFFVAFNRELSCMIFELAHINQEKILEKYILMDLDSV